MLNLESAGSLVAIRGGIPGLPTDDPNALSPYLHRCITQIRDLKFVSYTGLGAGCAAKSKVQKE